MALSESEITVKIEEEEKALKVLFDKRDSINEKIKNKQAVIERYRSGLRELRFEQAETVIKAKGVSIEDVLAAIAAGTIDITSLTTNGEDIKMGGTLEE